MSNGYRVRARVAWNPVMHITVAVAFRAVVAVHNVSTSAIA